MNYSPIYAQLDASTYVYIYTSSADPYHQGQVIYLAIYMPFGGPKIKSQNRIGPHNRAIIDVLIGNLQGDAHGELRSGAPRFSQHMSSRNREYLGWLHKFYSSHGYCSTKPIKYKIQIGKQGKQYYSGKQNTYTFLSLKWVYDLFYVDRIKKVPNNIEKWQTARALSIWFMDNGVFNQGGVLFSTYCFPQDEVEKLKTAIYLNFNIKSTIYHRPAGYILVIKKNQMCQFISVIEPYIIPSMLYKIKFSS